MTQRQKPGAIAATASAPSPEVAAEPKASSSSRGRLLALAALFVGLWVVGKWAGLGEWASPERIMALMRDSGPWGWLIFIGAWMGLAQMQLPGMIFIVAAMLIYGPVAGGVLSWFGGMITLALTFAVIRGVGGTPLAQTQRPWVRRALDHLDERPVRTIALLRAILVMNPAINFPIILGGVSFREHTLGSALGLVPPILFWGTLVWLFGPQVLGH